MEKHNNQEKKQPWGTWEELLLASAVKRHGFKDWDTVAMEVQTRTTLPHLLTTARNCELKFQDLKRRFTTHCNEDVPNGTDKVDHVPWLEELRKLRVAELRREVQRSDVSILSLQLKVKKMVEEDKEQSLKENEGKNDEKPDLRNSEEQHPKNDNKVAEEAKPEPASSEPVRLDGGNKPRTGDESDRENQSVNESNSTGSRSEGGKIREDNVELEKEKELLPLPVCTGSKEPNPVGLKGNPGGKESNNGRYDTVAKVPTCESLPPSEEHKIDDSSELRDSVAHSRDGERGTRESSEVQSSASLTRKRKTRRRKEVYGGTTENREVSIKSQPLVGVLELIKRHEHISLFERRLESQEPDKYKNIVRQRVDLKIIKSRLRKGKYSSSAHLFFRDLLLLFSNAVVFFPKDSTESRTALQLRRLVTNEIKNHIQTESDEPIPRKPVPITPNPITQPKPESLLSKDKASAPILVCRKRSSMSKCSSANVAQKCDTPSNDKKKPALDTKQSVKPSSSDSDDEPPKVKEKPVIGARSLRRSSNKNLSSSNPIKKLHSGPNPKSGSASTAESTQKNDKSNIDSSSDKKRSAAADFLKRIKRNETVEALRGGGGGGGGGSGKEQKKMGNGGKGDRGKERASRNNGDGSAERKRSVGRPPKKVAETSAKPGRETSGGKDKRPKKRSRT